MKTHRFLELFSLQLCRLFFHEMIKIYKGICSAWINRTSVELFFLIDWRHVRHKNTIEISLIYWNTLLWIFSNLVSTTDRSFFRNASFYFREVFHSIYSETVQLIITRSSEHWVHWPIQFIHYSLYTLVKYLQN